MDGRRVILVVCPPVFSSHQRPHPTVRREEHEERIDALKDRMKAPESKKKHRDRCCTVEGRYADFKTHRGLQWFSGCTRERADAQVGLTVLAHNLQTLAELRIRSEQREETPGKPAA
jgi:Transposase DDE domain